ncbi:MAG TPA: hypothetical protein VFX70_02590 [Mycobacteriales bacterium]|nr:hypothetical protein [Mycobacteriales bacterium]
MDRQAPGRSPAGPRWKRYGIHWHLFVRRHDLGDRARSAGSAAEVVERYRSDPPDRVGHAPPEVLGWQRERIREALGDATPEWADGRRQGLDDLDGEWARRLQSQLDKGLSSFQTVRVSDTRVVDVTAYAIRGRDCDQHQTR